MSTFLQLRGRLNDTVHGKKNEWQVELGSLVNDAYIHVVGQLRCNQTISAALPLIAADGDYSIVTDLGLADFSRLRVVKYTAANGSITLGTVAPTTPDQITSLRQLNANATSPAVAYALQGWDTLMLHPLPATGDTLTLTYTAVPAVMVSDSDTPTKLPQEWHHLISTRAAATAFEFFDDQRAILYMRQYEHELGRAHLWFNQHASSRGYAPAAGSHGILWPSDLGTSFSGV